MNIPGFTAEASVGVNAYRSYLAGAQGRDTSNRLVLAGSCTCTDPGCDNPTCTCTCPITDPCDQCDRNRTSAPKSDAFAHAMVDTSALAHARPVSSNALAYADGVILATAHIKRSLDEIRRRIGIAYSSGQNTLSHPKLTRLRHLRPARPAV